MVMFSLNRKLVVAFFLLLATSAVAVANGSSTEPMVAQGLEKIRAGALVIDVRGAEEFAEGHLDGAINIPHDQLAGRLDEVIAATDEPIVTYCRTGRRAGIAAQILLENGYGDVTNGGGFNELNDAQ